VNLHALLLEREAAGRPVTVGLIGAGKFGTMFLAQVLHTRGMHLVGIADLSAERAAKALSSCGWDEPQYRAASLHCPATSLSCMGVSLLCIESRGADRSVGIDQGLSPHSGGAHLFLRVSPSPPRLRVSSGNPPAPQGHHDPVFPLRV